MKARALWIALLITATAPPARAFDWYQTTNGKCSDPVGLGSLLNTNALPGWFKVGLAVQSDVGGNWYAVLPSSKFGELKATGDNGTTVEIFELTENAVKSIQKYLRQNATEELPFIVQFGLTIVGSLIPPESSIAVSTTFDQLSNLREVGRIKAAALSEVIAKGGKINVIDHISMFDGHPYLHRDYRYTVNIGDENSARQYVLRSCVYPLKVDAVSRLP